MSNEACLQHGSPVPFVVLIPELAPFGEGGCGIRNDGSNRSHPTQRFVLPLEMLNSELTGC